MTICFIDDSLAFDGRTPSQRALDGFPRALAALASALARGGREVTVVCNTPEERWVDGVRWMPMTAVRRTSFDLLIACRKPTLLDRLGDLIEADRKVLWTTADPALLTSEGNAEALRRIGAELMFVGAMQAARYQGSLRSRVVLPGVERCYLPASQDPNLPNPPAEGAPPPVAVVTGHPAHGLDRLIDLWSEQIAPQVPGARLHVYSALLSKPEAEGDIVPAAFSALYDKALAAAGKGVFVQQPLPDAGMARVYQGARLHLHLGHPEDFACWTIGESQACGVPAVGKMRGGLADRVINGQTGYLVPDDDAVANVAVQILTDDGVFARMAAASAEGHRRRTWDMAAREVEQAWMPIHQDPPASAAMAGTDGEEAPMIEPLPPEEDINTVDGAKD
jgi:hypothetical protein